MSLSTMNNSCYSSKLLKVHRSWRRKSVDKFRYVMSFKNMIARISLLFRSERGIFMSIVNIVNLGNPSRSIVLVTSPGLVYLGHYKYISYRRRREDFLCRFPYRSKGNVRLLMYRRTIYIYNPTLLRVKDPDSLSWLAR